MRTRCESFAALLRRWKKKTRTLSGKWQRWYFSYKLLHFVQGVLEFHDQERVQQHMDVSIEYFLDRFYMALISLRMLVNQHVLLFAPGADLKTKRIGVIDPECKLKVFFMAFAIFSTAIFKKPSAMKIISISGFFVWAEISLASDINFVLTISTLRGLSPVLPNTLGKCSG